MNPSFWDSTNTTEKINARYFLILLIPPKRFIKISYEVLIKLRLSYNYFVWKGHLHNHFKSYMLISIWKVCPSILCPLFGYYCLIMNNYEIKMPRVYRGIYWEIIGITEQCARQDSNLRSYAPEAYALSTKLRTLINKK